MLSKSAKGLEISLVGVRFLYQNIGKFESPVTFLETIDNRISGQMPLEICIAVKGACLFLEFTTELISQLVILGQTISKD